MRIIEQYNSDPGADGACDGDGDHTDMYGETEDYTVNVTSDNTVWTGAIDNNWHNSNNWNSLTVPDATTDVLIPDVTNKCWIYAGTANCDEITVEYGSGYDLRIWNQYLYVSGNMNMYGQLLMDHDDGKILFDHLNYIWGYLMGIRFTSKHTSQYTYKITWGLDI